MFISFECLFVIFRYVSYLVERSTDAVKHAGKKKEATWSIYDVEWADQYDNYKDRHQF